MSDGHSTARSLSLIECLNEWITHPSGTLGLSQLLNVRRFPWRYICDLDGSGKDEIYSSRQEKDLKKTVMTLLNKNLVQWPPQNP